MKRFAFLLLLTAACAKTETSAPAPPPAQPAGNAVRGQQLIGQYGCNACHIVPDFDGPQGSLGPSLAGVASRPTISFGTVPNTRANLAQFIQNPGSLNPQSTMTPVGVTPGDAQDLAAFLLTLK
jgi:cytochrome c2